MSEDKNLGNSELNAADEFANAPQEQPPVEYTDDNIPSEDGHTLWPGLPSRTGGLETKLEKGLCGGRFHAE